jgi:membrane protein
MRHAFISQIGMTRAFRVITRGGLIMLGKRALSNAWHLIRDTAKGWSDDNAARLAAGLAFYTVLSIAPLLVLAVAVASWVFGEEAARGQIAAELSSILGEQAGEGIETVLTHAKKPDDSALGSILGGVVLLFGASGVFGELQAAMNAIWRVKPKPGRGVWGAIKDRFFSFSMVIGVAFLLLVSLLASAALSAMGAYLSHALPGGEGLWQVLNTAISLVVISGLFALLFKLLPDVKIEWRHVRLGAFVTAVLFTVGKYALGLYLGRASVASPYGAAGSIVVLVIWVYYAAQIVFFGAEFTRQYALRHGAKLEPTPDAIPAEGPASKAEPSAKTANATSARGNDVLPPAHAGR